MTKNVTPEAERLISPTLLTQPQVEDVKSFNGRWTKRYEKNPELLNQRTCVSCPTILSRYNPSETCGPCVERRMTA
jgi:hypothetical protein